MNTTNRIFQKIKIGIIFIFLNSIAFGQHTENSRKQDYGYFSITPIEIFIGKYTRGLEVSSSLEYDLKSHSISVNALTGSKLINFRSASTFYLLNMLHGGAFKLRKIIYIDVHAGGDLLGFTDLYDTNLTRFGLPLLAKLRFKTRDRVSIGLKYQANINSIENIQAIGIVIQWNSIE